MKQLRVLASLITLFTPLITAGQAFAATQTVTQEIHITAVVPAHRDIVVDGSNHILEIISNTPQDVTPTVYYRTDGEPANIRPLSAELYAHYRQLVPEGTAKTGILYQFSPMNLASFSHTSLFSRHTPKSEAILASANPQPSWRNHFQHSLFLAE